MPTLDIVLTNALHSVIYSEFERENIESLKSIQKQIMMHMKYFKKLANQIGNTQNLMKKLKSDNIEIIG